MITSNFNKCNCLIYKCMGYICCQDYRNFLFSCLWFFFLIQCLTMLLENSIQINHIGVMIVSNWLALYKTCKSHVYCDNFVSKDNKMNCELMLTYDTPALRQTGSRNLTGQKHFPRYGVPIWSLWPHIRSLPSIVAEKNVTKNVHICSMCIKTN